MTDETKQDTSALFEALYDRGATPIYSSRTDARFAYGLYVPHRFDRMDRSQTTILVSVHGTGRMQSLYRDLFAEFAEYNNCIVLAPLFPANVLQDGNMSGYKYMEEGDIRYDQVVLGMIDEVAETYGVSGDKVLMFGFSGGGHFTHRFTILHPDRIKAASVGAPGSVTLIDFDKPWWAGVRDCEQRFGVRIDPDNYRDLPLHFVVGEADVETWEITFSEGDRYYVEGANDAGRNRTERIRTLAQSFEKCGARVRLDELSGVTHDVVPVSQKTREFFYDVLAGVKS
jgi:pimeloyl-ACP methyl ester carboxylesterase